MTFLTNLILFQSIFTNEKLTVGKAITTNDVSSVSSWRQLAMAFKINNLLKNLTDNSKGIPTVS